MPPHPSSLPALIPLALLAAGCITERSVVERSADAVSADLALALQQIDELRAELDALRAQVGETEETATLEERVRGLTEASVTGRVGALEAWRDETQIWRDDTVSPSLAALDGRVETVASSLTDQDSRLGVVETWRVAVDGALSDHEARIGALESDVADLIDLSSAIGGRVTTLEGWRSGTADPALTAQAASIGVLEDGVAELREDVGLLVDTVDASEDRWITEDTTWEVGSGGDFETPEEAWEAALGTRVVNGATLTLALMDGDYELERTWVLNHPDGLSLRIIGNEDTPGAVSLIAPGDQGGILVSHGNAFGLLSGVRIVGDRIGDGILATYGGLLNVGRVEVRNFTGCATATYGGQLHATTGGLDLADCGTGLSADVGATVTAPGTTVVDSWGTYGLSSQHGSVIFSPGAEVETSTFSGVWVGFSSAAVLDRARIAGSSHHGISVSWGSTATLGDADIDGAGSMGISAYEGAFVWAPRVGIASTSREAVVVSDSSLVDIRGYTGRGDWVRDPRGNILR